MAFLPETMVSGTMLGNQFKGNEKTNKQNKQKQ